MSNLSVYSLYHAETCNALTASSRLRTTQLASLKQMLQRLLAVGNTVSDFTGQRFEPLPSYSGDERVTARLIGRSFVRCNCVVFTSGNFNTRGRVYCGSGRFGARDFDAAALKFELGVWFCAKSF